MGRWRILGLLKLFLDMHLKIPRASILFFSSLNSPQGAPAGAAVVADGLMVNIVRCFLKCRQYFLVYMFYFSDFLELMAQKSWIWRIFFYALLLQFLPHTFPTTHTNASSTYWNLCAKWTFDSHGIQGCHYQRTKTHITAHTLDPTTGDPFPKLCVYSSLLLFFIMDGHPIIQPKSSWHKCTLGTPVISVVGWAEL